METELRHSTVHQRQRWRDCHRNKTPPSRVALRKKGNINRNSIPTSIARCAVATTTKRTPSISIWLEHHEEQEILVPSAWMPDMILVHWYIYLCFGVKYDIPEDHASGGLWVLFIGCLNLRIFGLTYVLAAGRETFRRVLSWGPTST